MSTQVYTFRITYNGCENKIWRTVEVSSNYDLARLGYMVLASFDTNAYHLFSIEHKGVILMKIRFFTVDFAQINELQLLLLCVFNGVFAHIFMKISCIFPMLFNMICHF